MAEVESCGSWNQAQLLEELRGRGTKKERFLSRVKIFATVGTILVELVAVLGGVF